MYVEGSLFEALSSMLLNPSEPNFLAFVVDDEIFSIAVWSFKASLISSGFKTPGFKTLPKFWRAELIPLKWAKRFIPISTKVLPAWLDL